MSEPMTTYIVQEGISRYGFPEFLVVRTDGARDWRCGSYPKRERAEFQARILEHLPQPLTCTLRYYRSGSMRGGGSYWHLQGQLAGDPRTFDIRWDEGAPLPPTSWCASVEEHLIAQVEAHVDGSAERIREAAEQQAIAEAEQVVRDQRAAHLAQLVAQKGRLATPKQVNWILTLLAKREISGDGGGFFVGPTDQAGIEELAFAEASAYIDSLTGNY